MLVRSLLVIGGAVALSVIACYIVRRVIDNERREKYNSVAGNFFSAVGAFYAILVAFVVVAVWEDMNTARDNTYVEANAIPGLYFASTDFSAKDKEAFQRIAVDYATLVVTDEWPKLAEGGHSEKVEAVAKDMRRAIVGMDVQTPRQQALYSAMIERVNTISSARRDRLNESTPSVPDFFWVGLIIGGVLLIGFALFFGVPRFGPHALMIAVLAMLVSASLYFTALMDHPFRGDISVQPDAFRTALTQMGKPAPG